MGDRSKELFLDALELDQAEREAFLVRECDGDAGLLERVRALLDAHGRTAHFLDRGGSSAEGQRAVGSAVGALEALDYSAGDVIGNYRLVGLLGEGGFGRVWRAEQEQPVRRTVALKLLKLGMNSKQVMARFEAERQTLALMDHPHIARVLDAGATEAGRPYFVIELVEGEPLTTYCERHGLELRQRVELVRQTCLAIQHAHSKGVLHRDVKPSNVLVTEVDGEPQPRVIDFGIAKAIGGAEGARTALTTEGVFLGTPTYMSPEQVGGAPDIDTRSDVYALGVLLYELLAGCVPFQARGSGPSALLGLQRSILEDEPRPPGAARRATRAGRDERPHPELDWIVLRCLEKDRERRYATAYALALDLERFLSDEPVEAAPPSSTYRLRKLVRRHRVAAAASAVAVLGLAAGVVGTSIGLVQAEREAEQARLQARIADAVNTFLTEDLLSHAQPSAGSSAGPGVLMKDVLDAAAASIADAAAPGGRFEEAPLVEASIRRTIAQTYGWLGQYPAALEHFRRAHELFARELGAGSLEAVESELGVAMGLLGTGRFEAGEQRARALIPALEEVFGCDSAQVARARKLIGLACGGQGRWDEAVEAYRAGLDGLAGGPEEDTDESLNLLSALAIAEVSRGRVDEADTLFRESARRHIEVLGPEEPRTLAVRINLATFLRSRERPDEARAILMEVVPIQERVLGADHPNTLVGLQSLGGLLRDSGEFEVAGEMLTRVVEGLSEQLGPGHPNTLAALHSLALLEDARGDAEGAEALLRGGVERARLAGGPRAHETLVRLQRLGEWLLEKGRSDEAEPPLLEARDGLAEVLGPGHARTAELDQQLATLRASRTDSASR